MRKYSYNYIKFNLPILITGLMISVAQAQSQDTFAIIAGSTITNTGSSIITGNIGLSPGSALTGFPPGTVTSPYTIYRNNAVAAQAQSDLTTAYNVLASRPFSVDLTGQDLGGKTLSAGVFNFNAGSQLTGAVTLDGQGNTNSVFVFNIGSTLTTASASRINLINGAQAANVYFRVGSSATLGSSTQFAGKILANTSITLVTAASIQCGAALARNGAVTLDTNIITICPVSVLPVIPVVIPSVVPVVAVPAASNTSAVSNAINRFTMSGAAVPIVFQVLPAVLGPTELARAYTELSGEAATAVSPAGIQSMNAFMSLMFDSVFADEGNTGPAALELAPERGTVRALGYLPENPPLNGRAPLDTLEKRITPQAAPAKPWSMWGGVYGGQSRTNGDVALGTHTRSIDTTGFAAGLDHHITADTRVGFAVAAGRAHFGLSEALGSGDSSMVQAALYAKTDFGPAYLTAAVAAGWHEVETERTLTIGGINRMLGSLNATNVAGQVEAGYRIGWLVPFAAIGVQAFHTPSYSETSQNGSIFALHYNSQTTTGTRTQLGLRTTAVFVIDDGLDLRLHTRTAWVHDLDSKTALESNFQSLPTSAFIVTGTNRANDTLVVGGGAELRWANGFSIHAAVDTQFAENTHALSGRGEVRYRW